jgi:2-methylcitrate dehydratase PrpD
MPANLMRDLARYIAQSGEARLPDKVVEKAKHHILDTLAAIISGAEFKVGRLSRDFVRGQGGAAEAQIGGADFLSTSMNAAFANGNMAHADETDDSHEASGTHPGCAIVPAALAVAEKENASGLAWLKAVVAGYDIGCRINLALDPDKMRERALATHSIGGIFGAATAATSLMKLDAARVRHVIDYTGQQASGIRYWVRDTEHVEKAFVFGGMPARAGVTAAAMVQAGFTGVEDCLTGENNLFQCLSDAPRPGRLIENLGAHYEVTATNIKKYCVGSPIQAPLEALTILIERHKVKAAGVKTIDVRMPSSRTVNDREMPDINLQYILAVSLLDGGLTFKAAHDFARMKAPEVVAMKARMTVTDDASLRLPHTSRTGRVELTMNDGKKFSEHVTAVPGVAENPMTTAQVEAKCRDIVVPYIGRDRTEKLITTIRNLEQMRSVRELRPLLAGR